MQTDSSWSVTPERYAVEKTGDYVFQVQTSTNSTPGRFPVVVEFKDEQGKALDMEAMELTLKLPVAERDQRFGFVVAEDFESGALAGWRVEKSAQSEIGVVQDGNRKVLRIAQKHIDLAAALSRETSPVAYGALEFEIKPSVQKQSFEAQYGAVRLGFDGQGGLRLLGENGKSRDIGAYQPEAWQTVRVFFAAPEGWCRVWVGGKYLGQFEVPVAGDGFHNLRLMAGMVQTPEPAVFLLANLKVVEIKPVALDSGEPLAWTICGPFPNAVDPKTMKRPYETDVDYLAPAGGLINLDPYPGLAVMGNGTTNMFLPFYPAKSLVDFFMVKDLCLYPSQGNILCYAVCYLISPEEKRVTIGVGSDDWCALWVNHKLMGKACGWPIGRNIRSNSEKYPVTLRKGLNLLLMCVDQGNGGFDFSCGME